MTARRTATALLLTVFAASAAAAQGARAGRDTAAVRAALVAQERAIFDAIVAKDTGAFNRAIGADVMTLDGNGVGSIGRAQSAEFMSACTTGPATIEGERLTPASADVFVLAYKVSLDQTCNGQRMPSPVWSMTVWKRQGARWVAVAHSETPATPATPAR